ncbi:MAG TPA: hybrid sensor histidine kinase/response regulator, partial [Methanoregula sp.]|nr:hybrid sensor histidine kinase/response regulator [Methanoregula sp.]
NPATILIVEDSRTQAELLKNILETHGYVPMVAENGKRALEIIANAQPDAIISDVLMPVMDGYELCRAIKNDTRYRHIPVILLTMLSNTQDLISAMESGADNFIIKPYQEEYILSRLNAILSPDHLSRPPMAGEMPFDIEIAGKTYTIRHDRRQIIDLLLSSYDAAILQHKEVLRAQNRLAEANDEANLYLDIITHDINNVNTGALALTELLLMKTTGGEHALARRLIASINQSIEIIGNVSTIRRLHEKKEAIHPINLDEVIKNEVRYFNTTRISFAGTTVQVLADTLVGQIFINLIGNSVKFAGMNAEITIDVIDKGDMVEIVVADNGPGVPDEMKPVIFDRFRKGKNAKSGKGLGLFIARTLVEMYGGTIWAGDRVPGQWDKGAAIHFTLKKSARIVF